MRLMTILATTVALVTAMLSAGPASAATEARSSSSKAVMAALAHPERSDGERQLDELRRPAEVLAFAGIEPGMTVAELMAGTGWYTEVLSRTLGPDGTLYMQNNKFVIERFAKEGVEKRLADSRLANVIRHDAELDDLGFEANSLDMAVMILFYHDTYWQGTDREVMNRSVFTALKPGAVFLIVDHYAEDGSGDRDVSTLHRGDAALIRSEILAAGFRFDGSSEVLRHPEDERTINVFDPAIRRKTDRFVYRFVKPGGEDKRTASGGSGS